MAMVGGGIVVTLGVAAALLARPRDNGSANAGGDPRKAPESVPAAPPTAPHAEEASKKSEPAMVQLYIQVTPSNAVVVLDGARLASNPFQAELRSDKGAHTLRASAPGYFPLEQMITYSNDTHLEIALRPAGGRPSRGQDEGRSAAEARNSRPAEPSAEPKKSEPEAEVKHRSATPPPRGIDEKNPYAQ
jgi:hypothetical protein